jgi:hypothetical protein
MVQFYLTKHMQEERHECCFAKPACHCRATMYGWYVMKKFQLHFRME